MKKILKYFLAWRILLFIPLILGTLFLPFRDNSLFTTLLQNTEKNFTLKDELIYSWANFDGVHYVNIASRGYIDEGRFLPLFPIIIKTVATPFSLFWPMLPHKIITFWSGILVSFLSTLLALYYLTKLLQLDYKSGTGKHHKFNITQACTSHPLPNANIFSKQKTLNIYSNKIIQTTLFLTLASPLAFFFATIYTEGLFLLLSVLTLYFARKKRWFFASLTAMFLSVTRLSGLLIILPLLWEYYELEIKNKNSFKLKKIVNWFCNIKNNRKFLKFNTYFNINFPQFYARISKYKKFKKILWFTIIPILLIFYSYFNYIKWDDFLYFVNAHGSLGNSRETTNIVFPLIIIYRYIKIFLTVSIKQYEFWIALLEFSALFYAVWNLYLIWKEKIRPSYQIFAWAMISLPLLSGTLSGFPRYILPIFPFFLAQSLWFNKNKKTKLGKIIFIIFITLSIILQALLLALFARGYYVS